MNDQARKDALADAETLRLVSAEIALHCYGGAWDGPPCPTCDAAVRCLRIYNPMESDPSWWTDPLVHAAALRADRAIHEARAAFRACPGLRE